MKQTICLLNDSFPPQIDGVANAVVNYATHIHGKERNATVITPDFPEKDDSIFNFPVYRYPSIDLRKYLGYLAGIPFSPDTARKVEEQNVAVLHSHCPMISTLLARQLRQIVRAPLVLTYHTKFDVDIASCIKSKMLQAGSIKLLVENINACDEVWTVSRGAGENLRQLGYEGEYIVMPNGVDVPKGRVCDEKIAEVTAGYDLPVGVPVYLFVGRMKWYKGLRQMINALTRLQGAGKDFRMVFIGDGADLEEVMAYAESSGISKRCIFTGAIHDREVLRAWYCRANLFLFLSAYDTNGLVVREAAACSLPSILLEGSCAAEDVTDGQNGFVVGASSESLFRLMLKLSDRMDAVRVVGENAAEQLYMSWEDAVKLAQARYDVVIDRYKSGDYPKYRHGTEYYLKANGRLMEDLGQMMNLRDQLREYSKSWYNR